jgi:hypothetical protein
MCIPSSVGLKIWTCSFPGSLLFLIDINFDERSVFKLSRRVWGSESGVCQGPPRYGEPFLGWTEELEVGEKSRLVIARTVISFGQHEYRESRVACFCFTSNSTSTPSSTYDSSSILLLILHLLLHLHLFLLLNIFLLPLLSLLPLPLLFSLLLLLPLRLLLLLILFYFVFRFCFYF